MSDPALRRTPPLHRRPPVLLSLCPVLFVDWLHTTRGREFRRPALAFGDELGLLMLLGACGSPATGSAAGLAGGTARGEDVSGKTG